MSKQPAGTKVINTTKLVVFILKNIFRTNHRGNFGFVHVFCIILIKPNQVWTGRKRN